MSLKLQLHFVDGFVVCQLGFWGNCGVCHSLGIFPPDVPICVMISQRPQSIFIDIAPLFSSSLCRMRWELHPKPRNPWKKHLQIFTEATFPPHHGLESTDLRNVLFLWAALTWILFVYGLVFVHALKVGFYFYSDKASPLLSPSNDENLPTRSLECLWLFQVRVLVWFFYFCKAVLWPAVHLPFALVVCGTEMLHICPYFVLFVLDHLPSLSKMS